MALDEKSEIDLQTGWIKWRTVKVILQTPRLLICEVNVENLSKYTPSGIVKVTLGEKELTKTTFKFWLKPSSIENLRLSKDLSIECTKIVNIIVDEE
jgi:hypothetical protein